eukprot:3053622-Pleurochrysis_carterae.AAC.1
MSGAARMCSAQCADGVRGRRARTSRCRDVEAARAAACGNGAAHPRPRRKCQRRPAAQLRKDRKRERVKARRCERVSE